MALMVLAKVHTQIVVPGVRAWDLNLNSWHAGLVGGVRASLEGRLDLVSRLKRE